MRRKRFAALLLALACCVMMFAGCGTSRISSVEESVPEEGSWVDLLRPSNPAKPSADTVMPGVGAAFWRGCGGNQCNGRVQGYVTGYLGWGYHRTGL